MSPGTLPSFDRMVVAVLDHRITRMAYGKVFLDSLPPKARTRDRNAVAAFFQGVRSAGAE